MDLVHNNYTQGPAVLVDASDGVQFLDLNQAGVIGGLFQVVNVVAGVNYHLTLDTTAWATNAIGGTIGYDLYDPLSSTVLATGTYTDAVGGTWINRELFADAISTQLGVRIYGVAATQAGMGLDNVQLTETSETPEPASFVLFAVASVGLLGLARRRQSHRLGNLLS